MTPATTLAKLNKVIDWEQFREFIELSREKPWKAAAGAKGQIVDASIVRVPIQRNSCEENKSITAGNKIME